MEITIELIEKVLDATDADYKVVKQALLDADGDADAAIAAIKEAQAAKEAEEAAAREAAEAAAKEAEEAAAREAEEAGQTEAAQEDVGSESEADPDAETRAAGPEAENQEEAKEGDWTTDWTTDKFADDMVEKLKKRVKEGNVDQIVVTKDDKTILSIPVNVGIVGGLIGFALIPWAVIFGALAAYGLNCKVKIVTSDGKDEEL